MQSLIIPLALFQRLSKKAYFAHKVLWVMLFLYLCELSSIPFLWPHHLLKMTLLGVMSAVAILGVVNGFIAMWIHKLIAGKLSPPIAGTIELSASGIFFDDVLIVPLAEVTSVAVSKYKGGCLDVVVHLMDGGILSMHPQLQEPLTINGRSNLESQRTENCTLCNLIREKLTALVGG